MAENEPEIGPDADASAKSAAGAGAEAAKAAPERPVPKKKKKKKKRKKKREALVFVIGESGVEEAMVAALDAGEAARVRDLAAELHHADLADIVERVAPAQRPALVEALGEDLDAEVISELDENVREDMLEEMDVGAIAQVVQDLESDDAVELVEEIEDEDRRREVLDAIPETDRSLIEEGLSYPEDSAGRLMQRELVTVPGFWTVGETIDFLRQAAEDTAADDASNEDIVDDDERDTGGLPATFYDIFVVDPARRPVGAVPLSRVLRSKRPVKIADIMETELRLIPADMDQEDVAFLFRQRDLVSAPVVDEADRLVGAITVDDVVDVIHEEHEEDLMRMGGVAEDDLYEAAIDTTKARFRWLLVNLATAVLASFVISLFEATLDQIVALAVLMPIVASMGGNAGTQTLTVAVRALAMRELTSTNALRVIGKEFLVGGVNGVVFAVITGAVTWAWFQDPIIGVIIGLAMIVNMVVAALAGASIPLVLDRAGIDPAIASSVFLTTVTDVVGFFAFLGLAALILL